MSEDVWNAFAAILLLLDFIAGWGLVVGGVIMTFSHPTDGWLMILGSSYMLGHWYLIMHSRRDER